MSKNKGGRPPSQDLKKKAILKLYVKYFGNVSAICRHESVNIGRKTFYEWYKTDEEFKKKIDELDVDEASLDLAEGKLHSLMNDKNFNAIKFYLENKGASRGYGNNLNVNMQVDNQQFQHDITEAIRAKHINKEGDK